MKKKIAITGGIGSGKSYLLHKLKEKGYPVFSCDEIYRELVSTQEYIEKISAVFPDCVVEGQLNRKLLAKKIFKNEENRRLLNEIAHPLIMSRLISLVNICEGNLVFAEVPLLFEGHFEDLFDEIIVVMRNRKERIASILGRDKITEEEATARIAAQFDYDAPENLQFLKSKKVKLIYNNGSLSDLDRQIDSLNLLFV